MKPASTSFVILLAFFNTLNSFAQESYGCGEFGVTWPCCCETASCYTCADIQACVNLEMATGDTPATFATALEPGDCDVAGTPCSTWWENNNYGVGGIDRGDGAPEDCLSPCGDPMACNYDPLLGPSTPADAQICTYGCGCSDPVSCNYDEFSDGSHDANCDYNCISPDCVVDPPLSDSALFFSSFCAPLTDRWDSTRQFDSSEVEFVPNRNGETGAAIQIGTGGYLQFSDGILIAGNRRNEYAVSCWFKLNADTTQDFMFAGGTLVSGTTDIPNVPAGYTTTQFYNSDLSIYIHQGPDEFYGSISCSLGGSGASAELTAGDIQLNEWQHISINKSENILQTWVNGNLIQTDTISTGDYGGQPSCFIHDTPVYALYGDTTSCWHDDDFFIETILTSQSNSNLSPSAGVAIDDLFISDVALSPYQIAQLAESPAASLLCSDSAACNFDNAPVGAESCIYTCLGCTDGAAVNFDANANADDGSCEYLGCWDENASNFLSNAATLYPVFHYAVNVDDVLGNNELPATTAELTIEFYPERLELTDPLLDDSDSYPQPTNPLYPNTIYDCHNQYYGGPNPPETTCASQYWRSDSAGTWTLTFADNSILSGNYSGGFLIVDGGYEIDSTYFEPYLEGCFADEYLYEHYDAWYLVQDPHPSWPEAWIETTTWNPLTDWHAGHPNGQSAVEQVQAQWTSFDYSNANSAALFSDSIFVEFSQAYSASPPAGCEYPDLLGCTDATACNFDPLATIDNGTCESLSCSGCTDWEACNYCYNATVDNGTCEYESCLGCWDDCACNTSSYTDTYYSNLIDDGSCEYTSCAGCTDPFACNFDPSAILSSAEACQFPEPGFDCNGNCTGPTTPSGGCDPDQFACSPYPVGVDTLNLPSTYIAQIALSGDGNILALGLPNTSANPGQYCGAVQVWEKSGVGWTILDSTLFGSETNAYFGTALDLNHNGTRLAVGSPANSSSSVPGAVAVFERVGSGYELLGDTLLGAQGGSRYGQAVAIDSAGVRILAGAPRFDSDGASNTGLMQVFGWNNGTWSLQASFAGDAGDEFGNTVTISDDGLTCAAGGRRNNGSSTGIVRAFRFFPAISSWLQRGADLTGLTNDYAGYYGTSLKLDASGLLMAIGAPNADHLGKTNCGRTSIYFWDGSAWTIVGQPIHGETAWDYSGHALDFADNGSSIFIGAYGNDGVTHCSSTGHVRNYRLMASSWQKAYPDIDGENASSQFGRTLAAARSGDQFVTNGSFNAIEVAIQCDGCTDEAACNFDPNATLDDGSCLYVDECAVCGGAGAIYECGCTNIPDGDCDCDGNQLDAIGVCGGSCPADADGDGICDDVDDCVGAYDVCGACNGPGTVFECGCADIPEGDCDCNGNQLDAVGICGGDCVLDTDGDGVCDTDEIAGCTDETACNYAPEATDDDGNCLTLDALGDCGGSCQADVDVDGLCDDVDDCIGAYDNCGVCNGPGAIFECGCSDIPEGDCDCNGSQLDALGVCGGTCTADEDADGICDDVDDCVGAYDACGVCNGPGAVFDCGCESIPEGDCDCDGNVADIIGVCGGDCTVDFDGDGVCDDAEVIGCTYPDACNYAPLATNDDGSCSFPDPGLDCSGNCLLDTDDDGICDPSEIPGCTDINALNYHPVATEDDGTCDFDLDSSCYGDVDNDGIIGVSDILDLLSNFGAVCDP